ncbi:MAG: sulfite oxidase [Cytophagales bacterium]|nr:sulfite oxidase [Cytophagales bacterium]
MTNRRSFIRQSALGGISLGLGLDVVFARNLPKGMDLLGIQDPYELFSKHAEMVLLNDRPWNMEAQAHLLNDPITPADRMFIRNNGRIPQDIDVSQWTLTIEGESANRRRTYTLQDLKSRFEAHTYQLTLECGGNGRSEFNPPAKGNQWTIGAVACATWTGVRLRDLLQDVGIKDDAVYIGYYGRDTHLSGDASKDPISRGVPLSKAMMEETMVAYAMNGEDIPLAHGFPLRLVAGGWPASASGKWLHKLVVRDQVHDGAKMGGSSYRVPCEPVAPGTKVADENMCIIESMPVKSLITYPKTGAMLKRGKLLEINGQAWAGELEVTKVEYSINFGATWESCDLSKPVNRLAWQQWKAAINFPEKGYYEVWARATDSNGLAQPLVLPGWNPKGYLNNACHRIAVQIN